jgi:hypothetical protein
MPSFKCAYKNYLVIVVRPFPICVGAAAGAAGVVAAAGVGADVENLLIRPYLTCSGVGSLLGRLGIKLP